MDYEVFHILIYSYVLFYYVNTRVRTELEILVSQKKWNIITKTTIQILYKLDNRDTTFTLNK